jgi:Protein of unknown function (DUF3147)
MKEILIRFLIGGISVSSFAVIGDLFKPKSFAGLFGAAPSVALATLALTVMSDGKNTARIESISMLAGSVALFCYASVVSRIMMRHARTALWVAIYTLPIWFGVSFGLWYVFLR